VQLYIPIANAGQYFPDLAMGRRGGLVSACSESAAVSCMTPLLIFVGIAPAVAGASVRRHIAASSFQAQISIGANGRSIRRFASVLRSAASRQQRSRHLGPSR